MSSLQGLREESQAFMQSYLEETVKPARDASIERAAEWAKKPPTSEDEWDQRASAAVDRLYVTTYAMNFLLDEEARPDLARSMRQTLLRCGVGPKTLPLLYGEMLVQAGPARQAAAKRIFTLDKLARSEWVKARQQVEPPTLNKFDAALIFPLVRDSAATGRPDSDALSNFYRHSAEVWVAANLVAAMPALKSLRGAALTLLDAMRKCAVVMHDYQRTGNRDPATYEKVLKLRRKVSDATRVLFNDPIIYESCMCRIESQDDCFLDVGNELSITPLFDEVEGGAQARVMAMQDAGVEFLTLHRIREEQSNGQLVSLYEQAPFKMPADLRKGYATYVDRMQPTFEAHGEEGVKQLASVEAVLHEVAAWEDKAQMEGCLWGDDFWAKVETIVAAAPMLRDWQARGDEAVRKADAWLREANRRDASKAPTARKAHKRVARVPGPRDTTKPVLATTKAAAVQANLPAVAEQDDGPWTLVPRSRRSVDGDTLRARVRQLFCSGTFPSAEASCTAHFNKHAGAEQSMEEYLSQAQDEVATWFPQAKDALGNFKATGTWPDSAITVSRRMSDPNERVFIVSNNATYLVFTEHGQVVSYRNRALVGR